MILSFEYTTKVTFCPDVGQHNILLRCQPAHEAFQNIISEEFVISKGFWQQEGTDGFGNRIIMGGTSDRHNELEYSCRALIDSSVYCIPDSKPHPMYGMLSPSIEQCNFLCRCREIMHHVHSHMEYCPGATDINTPLDDAITIGKGVCQDFAHYMIRLCRMEGIPARYVCGIMIGEGATHAWVETFDGQCWYAFDPTNDTVAASGYVKIAHGRNAHDCPVNRGIYTGISQTSTTIKCCLAMREDKSEK